MIKTMSQRFSQHFMAFMAKLTSKYSIYLILIAMLVICSILSPAFFSAKNLSNISRQISITTIISFGMTMLIISGMIDLAAGSVMALAGILAVACYKATGSLLISMLAGIVIGIACNIVSGFIVTRFKTPPFIATLATMTIFRGLALVVTDGRPVTGLHSDFFSMLGGGYVASLVPVPVIWMLVAFAVLWFVLRKTTFGRHVYAIGGNEEASLISGVRVSQIKPAVYALSGALSAMAGVILTSRLNSAQPNAGSGYELDAIAAVVLGGTSLAGGRGRIVGTLIGSIILGVLSTGLILMNVPFFTQLLIKGVVIILAVAIDSLKQRQFMLAHLFKR